MPVRIRLSRGGAKKRPYYRIVVADSRRSRDGKFIEQVGTYNPMLVKDNPERVKINVDKVKEWMGKGAQPSDRVKLFLSNLGLIKKPIITEKTKQHLPRKKIKEDKEAAKAKPAKADTVEPATVEPAKADTAEPATVEPAKADTVEPATVEPATVDTAEPVKKKKSNEPKLKK